MYEPRIVARTLIDRAHRVGVQVTNLKLQKLLYIAHGTMLAAYGQPLVEGGFDAWRYGPVNTPLYHDLKAFGSDTIKSDSHYIQRWATIPVVDRNAYTVIDAVIEEFGTKSGGYLVEWSHDKRGPWHAAYSGSFGTGSIDNEQIRKFFAEHVLAH